MYPATQKPIAWLLIATLAIVAGTGEGLHWIPGCGHGVVVGNLVLLIGIDVPDVPRSADGLPGVEPRQGEDIPDP